MPFVLLMVAAGGAMAGWIYGEAAGAVVKKVTGDDELGKATASTISKGIARIYAGPLVDILKPPK